MHRRGGDVEWSGPTPMCDDSQMEGMVVAHKEQEVRVPQQAPQPRDLCQEEESL